MKFPSKSKTHISLFFQGWKVIQAESSREVGSGRSTGWNSRTTTSHGLPTTPSSLPIKLKTHSGPLLFCACNHRLESGLGAVIWSFCLWTFFSRLSTQEKLIYHWFFWLASIIWRSAAASKFEARKSSFQNKSIGRLRVHIRLQILSNFIARSVRRNQKVFLQISSSP